ncbi:hypothetical protein [Rhodanobacter sp. DHB23]|uniref:hypothetical protein n=1 Tax=Rhodanobacter sp. DHB23 TaxID=2775923 RepID=UPI0017855131|nr:hypothetical protein [Rhodanobacter sp. DHB23]MBD8872642.1 hypothetical protein [Rhodanobacter sp. DHB23]
MNPSDDWVRWGDHWQRQPTVDADRLRRRVQRKRRQMQVVLGFECCAALFAIGQVLHLLLDPGLGLRWKVWAGLALLLVAASVYLSLRVRRGTWQATADGMPELLRLTAARARAGIRLAWLNIASIPLLIAFTLLVAAPWLVPSRWRHDPALEHLLLLQVEINGVVLVPLLVFFVVYIRRQRRRLRHVEALLRDYAE